MALSLQLQEREDFEGRTLLALAGGAAAGLCAAVAARANFYVDTGFLAVGLAALASAKVEWKQRLGLLVGLPLLLNIPDLLQVPFPLAEAAMGALAATVVGMLGMPWNPRPAQIAAGALGAGALVPVGLYVKQVMDARLFDGRWEMLGSVVGLTTVALFWGVGTLGSHVVVHGDEVEARGVELETRLTGETHGLVSRALALYRQCREAARKLAPGAGRTELLGVLEKMMREALTQAQAHADLETQLQAVVHQDVDAQVKELRARAAAASDPVARKQLELAASSLGEELNRLDMLERKRERLLAQLHAQVALLERARVSLVGMQGGDAAAKGAQAAQLARRLSTLGEGEGEASAAPPPNDSTKVAG